MPKIYRMQGKNISSVAIIGDSAGISDALPRYIKEGKLSERVDFGPIKNDVQGILSVSGNIYFPEICSLVAYYFPKLETSNTVVRCFGTSYDWAWNLLCDFSRSLQIKTIEPNQSFKDVTNKMNNLMDSFFDELPASNTIDKKVRFAQVLKGNTLLDFLQKASFN